MYTYRIAHMESKPDYEVGKVLQRGDVIGIMGSSGQSTAAHVHIDCVEGFVSRPFRLSDIGKLYTPNKKQLDLFVDNEMFGEKPFITTGYLDPEYKKMFGKDHPAYDVVPINRHNSRSNFKIFWTRSQPGIVSLILDDPKGYGHCVYIAFEPA